MIAVLHLSAAFPQTPAAPEPRKDTVVVTGTWDPVPLEESDRSLLTLPIRGSELLFNSYLDVLKLDSSVDLRQRAPNGIQADLSIRGATFNQTLVLLNGRRANDAQSGHHNLDIPFPLETMERVEVLHGAGSTLYGSDAVGGAANFRIAVPETSEIRLRGALGNLGVNQERVSAALVRGRFLQQIAASRDFSSGFMPNRDYRNLSIGSVTGWQSKLGATGVDLGYSDKPFGADNFYGDFNSWERTKTWYGAVRQDLGEKTQAAFSVRRHTDLFVLYRDRPQVYTNHHISESWQATLRRRLRMTANSTLFYGVEGMGDSVTSTNLGQHSRQRGDGYISAEWRALGRFSLTAGLRSESYRGIFDQLNPSVGGAFWASSRIKLRASAGRAFRLPTYTDLYYRDPANNGNADLQPETAWSYEGGVDWFARSGLRADATIFQRREANGIDYIRDNPTQIWQAANFTRLVFTGVEGGVRWQHRASILDLRYTGLRGVSRATAGFESKYVFNYPIHSGVVSWQAGFRGVAFRTRIGVLERRGRSVYGLWDVYGARAQGALRPFLQLTNLTGTVYQEIPGVPMQGFGIVGGVEWTLRRSP